MTNDDKIRVEDKEKVQSFLRKIGLISKIIGAVSFPVIGIIASAILHINFEEKRKSLLIDRSWENWSA